jgi:hypothetical protein
MHISKKYLNAHTIVLGGLVTVLLTSGVAYAANEWTGANIVDGSLTNADLASETITSGRILNATITAADIKDGSVTSADVKNESLTGTDVLNDSIGSADVSPLNGDADIVDNTITTFDIATNAIDSDEVLDFGLSNEDVGVLFAQVNSDGTIFNSSGGVTGFSLGTGTYEVDFGRDISNCGFTATQGEGGIGGAGGAIMGVTDRSGNANAVFATARDAAGALVNTGFQIVVVC